MDEFRFQSRDDDRQEKLRQACSRIHDLLLDERMRAVFCLWANGERHDAFARHLDIYSMPISQQRAVIKREKDRLRKYLRRNPDIKTIAFEALALLD
jgi:hypothetical protein